MLEELRNVGRCWNFRLEDLWHTDSLKNLCFFLRCWLPVVFFFRFVFFLGIITFKWLFMIHDCVWVQRATDVYWCFLPVKYHQTFVSHSLRAHISRKISQGLANVGLVEPILGSCWTLSNSGEFWKTARWNGETRETPEQWDEIGWHPEKRSLPSGYDSHSHGESPINIAL